MGNHPSLAQVNCTPMRFQPGDRILVRVFTTLTPEQQNRLRKSVEKWAGGIVEVLVIDARIMSFEVERADDQQKLKLPNSIG